MARNDYNNVFIGAAVGTLLGGLSAIFLPEREVSSDGLFDKVKYHTKGFRDKAMLVGGALNRLNDIEIPQNNFLKGTLLGLAIGATSLAFLSPDTNRKIKNGFMTAYNEVSDKAQELGRSVRYNHPYFAKKVRAAVKKHATVKKHVGAKKSKTVQRHKKAHV
jgi:gas vesicle protein